MSGDSVPAQSPLVVNGWSIYAHPLFLDQLEGLTEEVEARKHVILRPGARKTRRNGWPPSSSWSPKPYRQIRVPPPSGKAAHSAITANTGSGRNSSSNIGCSTGSTAMRRSSWWPG